MRGREHVAIAIAPLGLLMLGAISYGHASPTLVLGLPLGAVAGALAPDIDHPDSLIGNKVAIELASAGLGFLIIFGLLGWMASHSASSLRILYTSVFTAAYPYVRWLWLFAGTGVTLLVASVLASRYLPHRGPTHSLFVGAGLSILILAFCALTGLPWTAAVAFAWGYASHLIADSKTPLGCPNLLRPFAVSTQ